MVLRRTIPPIETNRKEPTVFLHSRHQAIEQLSGLPPALIISMVRMIVLCDKERSVCANPYRLAYEYTAVRDPRTLSTDFVMLNPITIDPAPREAIEQASHMSEIDFV